MEHFQPSAARGRLLADRIGSRLKRSLLHIAERSSFSLGTDFVGPISACIPQDDELGRISPALFGYHSAALLAADEQDLQGLRQALNLAASRNWVLPNREVVTLDTECLGKDLSDLYKRALVADKTSPLNITQLSAHAAIEATHKAARALELLHLANSDLAGELEAVLAQVVLVSGEVDDQNTIFAGASSFELWGAVFLNADVFADEIDFAIGVVHEVAHLILFAEAIDEPLVLNDPHEKYASPLRIEPRPMDGIFHATYVIARMHLAAKNLLAKGNLEAGPQERLQAQLVQNIRSFRDGWNTIAEHGRLTALGRQIIDAANHYMLSVSDEPSHAT